MRITEEALEEANKQQEQEAQAAAAAAMAELQEDPEVVASGGFATPLAIRHLQNDLWENLPEVVA